MEINNIELTGEKATLFITLYAKALDYRSKKSLLHDKMADDIIRSIDVDFSSYKSRLNLVPVRARQYDDRMKNFIKKEPNGIVVYLGCGMDTRIYRINPPETILWFDIDYPEVIELRKTLLPARKSYSVIASSITEKKWLEKIPNNRPTFIIAEGALEYLDVEDVKILFNRLTEYFCCGQLMFDVISPFAAGYGKKKLKATTKAEHKWTVDKIEEVDALNNKLKRESCLPTFWAPCVKELPLSTRLFIRVLLLNPKFKNMMRVLAYKF